MLFYLFVFAFFVEDTVYVKSSHPYIGEVAFTYPASSFLLEGESSIEHLLSFNGSFIIKEYGNLSSLSFRGNRIQDFSVELNGVPLKSVSDDYVDISLFSPRALSNPLVITHPLSSYDVSMGAAGGIFFTLPLLKNSAGINVKGKALNVFSNINTATGKIYIETFGRIDSLLGRHGLHLMLSGKNATFIISTRKARTKGPTGTAIRGKKRDFFYGYRVNVLQKNSVRFQIKGNYTRLDFMQGTQQDAHQGFLNIWALNLNFFTMLMENELILSSRTNLHIRNIFSIRLSKTLHYRNYTLTTQGAILLNNKKTNIYYPYFIGISRRIKNTVAFANYSYGVHFPSFFDLYWKKDAFAQGNPSLKPEHIKQWETGIKTITTHSILKLAFFRKNITEAIRWLPQMRKYRPFNFKEEDITGIELNIIHKMGHLHSGFSGSFSFFNNVLYYPHLSEGFWLKYRIINLYLSYVGRRQRKPQSPKRLGSMEILSLTIKKDFAFGEYEARIRTGISNLLAEKIEWIAGYPEMGKNWFCEIKITK